MQGSFRDLSLSSTEERLTRRRVRLRRGGLRFGIIGLIGDPLTRTAQAAFAIKSGRRRELSLRGRGMGVRPVRLHHPWCPKAAPTSSAAPRRTRDQGCRSGRTQIRPTCRRRLPTSRTRRRETKLQARPREASDQDPLPAPPPV